MKKSKFDMRSILRKYKQNNEETQGNIIQPKRRNVLLNNKC